MKPPTAQMPELVRNLMWNDFYNLNKQKLIGPFLLIWAIFYAFIILLGQFPSKSGVKPPISEVLTLGFIYSFSIISMAAVFSILVGYLNFRRKRKQFRSEGIKTFLYKYAFQKIFLYGDVKFKFTEEAYSGSKDGYPIIIDWQPDNPKFTLFKIYVQSEPIPKARYRELKTKLKKHNAAFDLGFILSKVSKSSPFNNIEKDLANLLDFLKLEQFRSEDSTERLRTT